MKVGGYKVLVCSLQDFARAWQVVAEHGFKVEGHTGFEDASRAQG